jgi:gliding motility-associated-like protein
MKNNPGCRHLYAAAANITLLLYASVGNCSTRQYKKVLCAAIIFFTLAVQAATAQVKADFDATVHSGCSPLVVDFINTSTGNIQHWKWDLGNGGISYLKNPSASYVTPGRYKVSLIAYGNNIADSVVKENFIEVYFVPEVNFTNSAVPVCQPFNVQFTDRSTPGSGSIISWKWDFGDGGSDTLQHPAYLYKNAGPADITLEVTNSYGCRSAITKYAALEIPAATIAGFTHSTPASCRPPLQLSFENSTNGNTDVKYSWSFGDGHFTDTPNPQHIFTRAGNYNVQLAAYAGNGCVSNFQKTIIIDSVATGFLPATACVGNDFIFTPTHTGYLPGCRWDFGDGTTSNVFSPAKRYTNPGNYPVSLVVDYGACTDTVAQTITVWPKPAFDVSDSVSCKPPFTVRFFSNLPPDVPHSWSFGDGTFSSEYNPSHTYTAYGNYTVMLVAGCGDTVIIKDCIKIQTPAIRLYNLPVEKCLPLTQSFSALVTSVVPVSSYLWDFGNGVTSGEIKPQYTYTEPGRYDITLTITTADGCTFSRKMSGAVLAGNKPAANFTADIFNFCASTPVTFTDLSSRGANNWAWDFGDGDTSQRQHPVHFFRDTGRLTVRLISRNFGCADTMIKTHFVQVTAPVPKFIISGNCSSPFQRIFENYSIAADSLQWDFGDGKTAYEPNPVHEYDMPGVYKVKLTVYNNNTGCENVLTKTTEVLVTGKPVLTTSDTAICAGATAIFEIKNVVKQDIKTVLLDFGDGNKQTHTITTSASLNFQHKYQYPGIYTVSIVVFNRMNCTDTIIGYNLVKVGGPAAAFSANANTVCPGSEVEFTGTATSVFPVQYWQWNFGDVPVDTMAFGTCSYTYALPGTYSVRLKVTDSLGCSAIVFKTGFISVSKPIAGFGSANAASCLLQPVRFTNTSVGAALQYQWDFGDAATSTSENPIHLYKGTGSYPVRLVVTDQYGCSDTLLQQGFAQILEPVAGFTINDTISSCPPFFTKFTNTSTGYTALQWDFGDGSVSLSENPEHSYTLPGVYTATLSAVAPGGCVSKKSINVFVGGPTGAFTVSNTTGCDSLRVQFTGEASNSMHYTWDFGDGGMLHKTTSQVHYTYSNAGIYEPKMLLEDSAGCKVAIKGNRLIKVVALTAGFDFSRQQLCDSGIVQFTPAITATEPVATYRWHFGDTFFSGEATPAHLYHPGNYYPELNITSLSGCTASYKSNIPVVVGTSPGITIKGTLSGCAPFEAAIYADEQPGTVPVQQWYWSFSNGAIDTARVPMPQVLQKPGVYTVVVKAVAADGCATQLHTPLYADAAPIVTIRAADTLLCAGSSIVLQATGAAAYEWAPIPGLGCYDCASPVAAPALSVLYSVVGKSLNGCMAEAHWPVHVVQPIALKYNARTKLCNGSSVTLQATGANKYEWWPTETLSNTSTATTVAKPVSTTVYRVVGTDDKKCFADTGYITVEVHPLPTVDAGADKVAAVGQPVELVPALSTDVTEVYWSPTGSQFRNIYPGIVVKPEATTEYTCQVVNGAGCTASDKVKVAVLCNGSNLFLPNTFSPNGDGVNDVFYPRGTGITGIRTLKIFNRGGQLVFEKNNFRPNDPGAGWDGTCRGRKLSDDVFIYTIEFVCDNKQGAAVNGNVYLLK